MELGSRGQREGERNGNEDTHIWQNHKAGAWAPDGSRDALSALDDYLQTWFMWERKKLLTCYLVFPVICRQM